MGQEISSLFENYRLNEARYKQAIQELEAMRQQLSQMTSTHRQVKNYHDEHMRNQNSGPVAKASSVLLMGPKGAGKTTFLALRGVPVAPSNDTEDGTKDIIIYTDPKGVSFIDSIGIGFDNRGISKMLAYFMFYGFPSSVICFCGARSEREYGMLTHFYQINNLYLCEFNSQRLNADHHNPRRNQHGENLRDFYKSYFCPDDEKDVYPKIGQPHHITHLDELDPNRGSFVTVQEFLCNGTFPEPTVSSSMGYNDLFKFQVFYQMLKLEGLMERLGRRQAALYHFFNDRE